MPNTDFDGLFITEIGRPSEVFLGPLDPESHLRNAMKFFKHLPRIAVDELPKDQRECTICHEEYGTDGFDKIVVQLPFCGHKFGFDCLDQWLSVRNKPNRNTCPICRDKLFDIDHSGWTDDDDPDPIISRTILPELHRLIQRPTIDSFVAAVDLVEPYLRGTIHLQQGMEYSRQLMAIFVSYKDLSRIRPLPYAATCKLAALMGQLEARFGQYMAYAHMDIPWRENGPPARDLIDPEKFDEILEWLHHFNDAEFSLRVHSLRSIDPVQ